MMFTNNPLTEENRERIAREINELLNEDELIVNPKDIRDIGIVRNTTYIAFCSECNVRYRPGSEEPIKKIPI